MVDREEKSEYMVKPLPQITALWWQIEIEKKKKKKKKMIKPLISRTKIVHISYMYPIIVIHEQDGTQD